MEDLFFRLVTVIGPLILAVTVHEFSHVAMAKFLGDDLGQRMGRYTLDPLKHIDPIWTVALPAVIIVMSTMSGSAGLPLFAAGKPAPYNPLGLKRKFFGKRIPHKFAELLIAVAGPLSNLALAFISMIAILLLSRFGYDDINGTSVSGLFLQFIFLNVALCVFNLIPVPPLDGCKVLVAFLPRQAAEKYEALGMQLSWVLLALLIFGGGTVIYSMVRAVVSGMAWLLA